MYILKTSFCWFTVLVFDWNEGWRCLFEWNIKLILCVYICCRNIYLKRVHKNLFLFNMMSWLELTIRISYKHILGAAIQEYLQGAFFNIGVLHLWRHSLKNTCDGQWFLVNLHLTLSNSEPLLQKFKYFVTTLINEQLHL